MLILVEWWLFILLFRFHQVRPYTWERIRFGSGHDLPVCVERKTMLLEFNVGIINPLKVLHFVLQSFKVLKLVLRLE